ncbi:MAG: diacylglycerol/lipid kinase family protein [Faecousia sp.]
MKKMLFIMNPYSGKRRANRNLVEILELFNRAGYLVTVHMTAGQGDATEIARQLGPGMDIVVCCGGDGTFNETVAGLQMAGADVSVGYIPAGSTNDFAASLKLPTEPLEAAREIVEGSPVYYDAGSFNGRFFSYVASFGAFTRTSYTTPQSIKNALGHTAYVLSGISELSQIHTEHVRLEINDEIVEDDFLFGAICNSTSVGGILTLDPRQVDMADGKLEVLLVRSPKSFLELTDCIAAVQSQQYNNCEMITFRSCSKIQITADPEMPWTLDGEREDGHRDITITNHHLAYRLVQKRSVEDA